MEGQPQVKSFNILEHLFGKRGKKVVSEESFLRLIDEGSKEGIIDSNSKEMIEGILDFNGKSASEVMTPRTEIVGIDKSKGIEEIADFILETNFSRFPVYDGDIHKIIGILYAQDFLSQLFKCQKKQKELLLEDVLKKPYIVPEAKNIRKLLKELQSTKNSIAVVCDEYGDFSGIVTLEDILEEIIDDIQNETSDDTDITLQDDGSYLVDGLVHIDDINKRLNIELECEHYDTISGFVIHQLKEIPKDLVTFNYKDMTFEIKNIKGNRVEKLKIYKGKELSLIN
ncbi:hypothetical protein AN641_01785 [Candidatus Epulonipiscioides gigas]|nr:hypothetical protein AN641_01785 [Epulopiscium sp. SCG-C07WGA-EpuloA2]